MFNQYYKPYYSQYQPMQPGMQGRVVESEEVVRAMDIPLDGSVSYFPLANGTAIYTKQLMNDGTSRVMVYKPIEPPKEENLRDIVEQLKKDVEELKRGVKNESDSNIKPNVESKSVSEEINGYVI